MNAYIELFEHLLAQLMAGLPTLTLAIVVCVFLHFVMKWLRKKIVLIIRSRAEDPLLADFANSALIITQHILLILVFLFFIGKTSIATSLIGAASVSAFVIGFAFKDIGENFLAGLIMAFHRPFRIGDIVKSGAVTGKITTMTLRHTHVKTFDGKDVYIPNGQIIKNPLYNYTIDGFLRQEFELVIAQASDISLALSVIKEEVENIPGILTEEKSVSVFIPEIKEGQINIMVQYWVDTFCTDHSTLDIKTHAIQASLDRLKKENIMITGNIISINQQSPAHGQV